MQQLLLFYSLFMPRVDMHFRDGYVIVMDGPVGCWGAIGVRMVRHLAGVHLRHCQRFFRLCVRLFFPQLLLQPHFQVMMKRHCTSPFPVRPAAPNSKCNFPKNDQIKLMNTVITRLFKKSANKLPTSGMSRYALTEGEYLSQMACMLAIALGVAPMPKPQVPLTITAAS